MARQTLTLLLVLGLASSPPLIRELASGKKPSELKPQFQTSDRCLACHNGLSTPSGQDVSIGIDWRSSMMANSSRDPYWQGSVRREMIDHAESRAAIEDECTICHMPMTRFEAHLQGRKGELFSHLPFDANKRQNAPAEDGVSCSVCHQIANDKLGTPESFTGGFIIHPPAAESERPEFGPFAIEAGQQRIMDSSSGGFRPTEAAHIRDSALCATCHTLITHALGPGGEDFGRFPEQMPYLEWLHSDYPTRSSCQSCHMPEVHEEAPIAAVLGVLRPGVRQHTFVAANFFMQRMLNLYRTDLLVAALPEELTRASQATITFLQAQSATVSIRDVDRSSGSLRLSVFVQNLTGHKLPTAYPSRRMWLQVTIHDRNGRTIFESGTLNPDGSIQGNPNDADPKQFEPHHGEITRGDQVQIYEPILKDSAGGVTTGLLHAVGYLKDNRLLPFGFNKQTAGPDITVVGEAAEDPNFNDQGSLVRYSVAVGDAPSPFQIEAKLWYQPIGFRWAHNLVPYDAAEPKRFVRYYDSMAGSSAVVLAQADVTH